MESIKTSQELYEHVMSEYKKYDTELKDFGVEDIVKIGIAFRQKICPNQIYLLHMNIFSMI